MTYKERIESLGTKISEDGGAIGRHFPSAEYNEQLVTFALEAARAARDGREGAIAYHVSRKDRRPAWGDWDGRLDFRTERPAVHGVEVLLEVPAKGQGARLVPNVDGGAAAISHSEPHIIAAMVRHNRLWTVPGTSGDPMGLNRQVIVYSRPLTWGLTAAQKAECQAAFERYTTLIADNAVVKYSVANPQTSWDGAKAAVLGVVSWSPALQKGGWKLVTVCGGLTYSQPPLFPESVAFIE